MADSGVDVTQRRFGLRDLFRVALWGVAAAGALALAVFAASSQAGTDRLLFALAHVQGTVEGTPTPDENDARKLTEAVRALAADRDRLVARINTLERNLDVVTGSITRPAEKALAPPPATPPFDPAPLANAPASIWPNVPVPRPAPATPQTQSATPPDPALTKTEFGIDLGGASAVEGLRALWAAVRGKHGGLLDGLRPVVMIRESTRPGGVELRLVVGPIANAATAARICAALAAAGAACQPAVFDGQRLALR